MREANATPEQTLMIGDSDVDVLTARNVGASVIGCRLGSHRTRWPMRLRTASSTRHWSGWKHWALAEYRNDTLRCAR